MILFLVYGQHNLFLYFYFLGNLPYNDTEKYKEIADKKTIEELRAIIGNRKHHLDFDDLLKSGQIGMTDQANMESDDDYASGNLEIVHEDDEPGAEDD